MINDLTALDAGRMYGKIEVVYGSKVANLIGIEFSLGYAMIENVGASASLGFNPLLGMSFAGCQLDFDYNNFLNSSICVGLTYSKFDSDLILLGFYPEMGLKAFRQDIGKSFEDFMSL